MSYGKADGTRLISKVEVTQNTACWEVKVTERVAVSLSRLGSSLTANSPG